MTSTPVTVEATSDLELSLILKLTRNLPRIRGAGVLANLLMSWYRRRPRPSLMSDVLGFRMELDPQECVDAELLFYPQLRDHREVQFMQKNLAPGGIFLDIGAHIGFYSLLASRAVGPGGRIISIEANPYSYSRLLENLRHNKATHVTALQLGVSDVEGELPLILNERGNRGGSTFLANGRLHHPAPPTVTVRCLPLLGILERLQVSRCDGMKLDIEGFEYRVLRRFLLDAPRELRPRFIIIEFVPDWVSSAGGDSIQLLVENGYAVHGRTRSNHLLLLR